MSTSQHSAPTWVKVFLVPALQLAVALVISSLVVLLVGESPTAAFSVMIQGATNLEYGGLSNTLYYATNFVFTGLAVAIAFHAGLFNIGGEGQAYIAGLGIGILMLLLDDVLSVWLMAPLAIIVAAAFGALWGAIPGYLQAKRGSHIVVTTIMFNFIAFSVMGYALVEHIAKYGGNSTDSRYFNPEAVFPKLYELAASWGYELPFSLLNPSILLALVVAYLVWLLLFRTRLGYAIRVVGQNAQAAEYAGIDAKKIIIIAMTISGALAGLMAVNEVFGAQNRLILNFTGGFGFIGIAVALMGRNHPAGIIVAALLFGALYQGGTELQFEMPSLNPELIMVIQGLVIFFTGALDRLIRKPVEGFFMRRASNKEETANGNV
ncbi:ABC transporter permease [Enterovibrio makurazakiensis]|uniref:ABC transporter permease n=1 Tax=Enterovibrio gelatinilyticus TaxID=2899819 RepID=A0ABT5R5K9_9GAMM|nr:ABC transporter permease [Enterovibrio sp. ZSDZ42]MDD1795130.1 ABC transporter permease [Enterovibrio sp. ZSDZ42]